MEENKDLVTEVTENAEQTAEEIAEQPKMFTQEELEQAVSKGKAREKAKIRRQYEKKYSELESVLKAGTGKESINDIANSLRGFYAQQGIDVPQQPNYSQKDLEVLAKSEAKEVINGGFDDVVDEVDRLTAVGVDRMTDRERLYFNELADYRKKAERQNELKKIGVSEDEYESREFKDFASKFNENTPIADIYNIYEKTKPKKEIEPMGSMENKTSDDGTIKDFYTRDEALKFTKADFDKSPELFKAVQESMLKW